MVTDRVDCAPLPVSRTKVRVCLAVVDQISCTILVRGHHDTECVILADLHAVLDWVMHLAQFGLRALFEVVKSLGDYCLWFLVWERVVISVKSK